MKHWIFFGHSHLAAVQRGWAILSQQSEFSNHRAHFFIIDHENVYEFFSIENDKTKLSEKILAQVNAIIENAQDVEMVLSLAGNDHSIIGLAKAEHEYQVCGDDNKSNVDHTQQILSHDLLKAVFEERLVGIKELIPQLIEQFQLKTYLLESPPPLSDENRIKQYPGVFAEVMEKFGVNSSQNRLSLWRIQNQVMHQYAADNQISFINNPEEIFDKGFLSENFAGRDPTHGNDDYGVVILKNVIRSSIAETSGLTTNI